MKSLICDEGISIKALAAAVNLPCWSTVNVGTVNVYNQKVGYSTFACRISLAENFSVMFFVMDFGSF